MTMIERARQGRLITTCLLAYVLIALALAASALAPRLLAGSYAVTADEAVSGGAVLLLLLLVYGLRRIDRLNLAGSVLVVIALVALGAVIYLFPAYQQVLLPAAALPVALAALLLSFQAVYVVALLAGATAILAWWLALGTPLPLPLDAAPPAIGTLTVVTLLALIVAPLRRSLNLTRSLAQHADASIERANEQIATLAAQRANTEAQQQRERQHLEAVFNKIGDGILFSDGAGNVAYANSAAQQLWAATHGGELAGRPVATIAAALRGANDQNIAAQAVELIEVAPDAERPTYVLLDRRERARLARLRGELLELLAEEMRDPLTSMLTALEMTLGQSLPDGADRVLVGARRNGQQLLDLIVTLLDINQMEESHEVLRRSQLSLRSVIEGGIAQSAPLAQKNSVHVVVEYGGDALLPLDKDRLRRAFVNLLDIALRRSPPYSTVQVQTQRQGSALVVRVCDQGAGLPVEKGVPTLGFTFSRLVIEAHGGKLWQEENRNSQGSAFAFSLPLEKAEG
ncbi:MAG: PAS domain-containing sensor histidine kinase [Chloroflexales bacterium]|nr:PAS domain-containing sensor histidine kinase [Chloroflexales bacterium]